MDRLPQEIIDRIAFWLSEISISLQVKNSRDFPLYGRLSRHSTISRPWQKAIESILFKTITIHDGHPTLSGYHYHFEDAICILGADHGRRLQYVRRIKYKWFCPRWSEPHGRNSPMARDKIFERPTAALNMRAGLLDLFEFISNNWVSVRFQPVVQILFYLSPSSH